MRDLLVTGIVIGVLPFVIKHAYIGVLLWTWISIMNPHRMAWSFAYDAPFAAMAAGATLISLFTTRDPVRLPNSAAMYVLIAFVVWMCLTTVTAFYPADSFVQLQRVLKIQLMTLVALAVLHEPKHIQLFVWINVLSLGLLGAKGGLYTIATAGTGTVWGPGGFIGGNNEFGLALVMTIPLMNYLRMVTANRWIRYGLVAMMLFSVISILGTQSRGAFLAICAMTLMLWWRSPKKFVSGTVLAVVGALMLTFMADKWVERMKSIENYEEDGSAMGRINAWWTMYNVASDRIMGAGFEAYNPLVFGLYAPDPTVPRAAHSIYLQILGEHGWIGLILFLIFWLIVWHGASRLRKQARGRPDHAWIFHLAGMSQVALVGYAVGGAFLSLAYFDYAYNIMVWLVVTQRWLTRELESREGAHQARSDHVEEGVRAPQTRGMSP